MVIFLILTIVLIAGIILTSKGYGTEELGIIFIGLTGILLLGSIIALLTYPMKVESNINKFLATKTTIEIARKTGVSIENAAIQHKIIESNQWLARKQYYNSTIFELWIPDEVDNLKPIR